MIKFDKFKNILKHLSTLSWKTEIPDEKIYEIAVKNLNLTTDGHSKNKKLLRLAGQSGSGKTTQLSPTAKAFFNKNNSNPIVFCVRNFAHLHPNYDELLQKFGKAEIREKTNCFALKCLLVTLIQAISEGYDIILEVTLLSIEFEDFLNFYLDNFGYDITYFCLAVNQEISDSFILKRQQQSLTEGARVVYKSSADFFYQAVEHDLIYLSKTHPNKRIIIWNAFDSEPKYDGKIADSIDIFKKEQKKTSGTFADERKLLDAKINYILKNL